jgi:DNA/RNA-binding domain of Phe-tRNA-synthetase-like protein
VESLKAWREAFRTFGVDPTKYRSAAEALARRLTKKDEIPSINTLVDLGNLISIRYGLPVAIVDVRDLAGGTLTVHFAKGDEPFTPLNAEAPEYPDAGEVVFTDENKEGYARRWCWRQSAASAAREDTTRIIATIEAHHAGGEQAVKDALRDLRALLTEHASFRGEGEIIKAGQTSFSA